MTLDGELYRDQIAVAANRQDEEPWRLVRLHYVIGFLAAVDELVDTDLLTQIVKLYDHKGVLTVTWRATPTEHQKALLSKAWGSRIGDGASENVEHELLTKP